MNNYYVLHGDLAKLPPLELSQLLAEVLPIGEIKAGMDVDNNQIGRFSMAENRTFKNLEEESPRKIDTLCP